MTFLDLKPVVVESPYAGDRERNDNYLKACMLDCLSRREAPFASHLLYPEILDDDVPHERRLGIEAGFAWGLLASVVVVYTDFGISEGMRKAVEFYRSRGLSVEFRSLKTSEPAVAA